MKFRATILTLSLALFACSGGGDPKEAAYEALQSGDYAAAVDGFGALVAKASPGSPEHLELAVEHCRALAHTSPETAQTTFIALADELGEKITPKDYSMVVTELAGEKAFMPAIALLEKAGEKYADNETMKSLFEKVKARVEAGEDPEAVKALSSLPYAGG